MRPAEEVFSPAAMASFEGKPVTNDRPPVLLDPKTVGIRATPLLYVLTLKTNDVSHNMSRQLLIRLSAYLFSAGSFLRALRR